MSPRMKKWSAVWSYFTVIDPISKIAQCDICSNKFSFNSTITNLKKHMERKHPSVDVSSIQTLGIRLEDIGTNYIEITEEPAANPEDCETTSDTLPTPSGNDDSNVSVKGAPTHTSTPISKLLPKKLGENDKNKLDSLLLKLFTIDYHPFSIVEDRGFVEFIKALNPAYSLPSRKSITAQMIPAAYKCCMNVVRRVLSSVTSVCLTTDGWTSKSGDSYLAVTAHFISKDFELKSVLLQCSEINGPHTSANLAVHVKDVAEKFALSDKVSVVVTDDVDYIKNAITEELGWKHFVCYARTLNSIVKEALGGVKEIHEKVKLVVSYFKRNIAACEKLLASQRHLGISDPKKLTQEIPSSLNSTLNMLRRITELKVAVNTVALICKDLPVLSEEEWQICQELCIVLRPFEELTGKLDGDKYIHGSQIIVLTSGLVSVCGKLMKENFNPTVKNVIKDLQNGLSARFQYLEFNENIALSTFLDPRFKLVAFSKKAAVESIEKIAMDLLTQATNQEIINKVVSLEHSSQPNNTSVEFSVWEEFDKMMETSQPQDVSVSRATTEVQSYLEASFLRRDQDPLMWWKIHVRSYPTLAKLVVQKFNTLATSVPCERLYSKAGIVKSERRTHLSASHVEKLLFLNSNSYLL